MDHKLPIADDTQRTRSRWTKSAKVLLSASLMLNLLLVPVAWNTHLRFTYSQTLARWLAKVSPPRRVYLGDSIMAGARDFGDPSAINMATSGLHTYQIAAAMTDANKLAPREIVVMAGMNDLIEGRLDLRRHASLWRTICQDSRVTVVLLPPTSFAGFNRQVDLVNGIARRVCATAGRPVVSLDALRGSDGLIKPEYTVDGVHLSAAGYQVWQHEMAPAL